MSTIREQATAEMSSAVAKQKDELILDGIRMVTSADDLDVTSAIAIHGKHLECVGNIHSGWHTYYYKGKPFIEFGPMEFRNGC